MCRPTGTQYKKFSYKTWESVREVMKCLGKMNFEFMYYERKLRFLHNMLVCNNSIISCMMPMYMQSNEYIQLCERGDISAQQTIASIRCHLFQTFCSTPSSLCICVTITYSYRTICR